jgi:hypothetical protein
VLDCYKIGSETRSIGIPIERLKATGIFTRVGNEELESVDRKQVSDFKREDIFVKQQRKMANTPAHGACAISVEDLERSGIMLRDSIPHRENLDVVSGAMKLPLPLPRAISGAEDFFVFRFVEKNSENGCIVFLERKKRPYDSSITSLSATVLDISEWSFSSILESPADSLAGFWYSPYSPEAQKARKQLWGNRGKERIFWQHPAGWCIGVAIKNGIVSNERTKIVHIKRHTPRKNDEPRSPEIPRAPILGPVEKPLRQRGKRGDLERVAQLPDCREVTEESGVRAESGIT